MVTKPSGFLLNAFWGADFGSQGQWFLEFQAHLWFKQKHHGCSIYCNVMFSCFLTYAGGGGGGGGGGGEGGS